MRKTDVTLRQEPGSKSRGFHTTPNRKIQSSTRRLLFREISVASPLISAVESGSWFLLLSPLAIDIYIKMCSLPSANRCDAPLHFGPLKTCRATSIQLERSRPPDDERDWSQRQLATDDFISGRRALEQTENLAWKVIIFPANSLADIVRFSNRYKKSLLLTHPKLIKTTLRWSTIRSLTVQSPGTYYYQLFLFNHLIIFL